MFRISLLRVVPFILCNLLAPDTGGGSGSGSPPPQPDPPPPPTKPEPEGETLEAKNKSLRGIVDSLWAELGAEKSRRASSDSQRTRLEGQFNAAAGDLTNEKGAHDTTKGLLATANTTIAGLTSERDAANGNVERLEKLCSLRGIDSSAAVPVPPAGPAANSGAAKWEKYNELQKQERAGEKPSGAAMAYYRENKDDLIKFAASKR